MLDFTIDISVFFIAIGLLFTVIELYFLRKSEVHKIEQHYQEQYDELVADRGYLEKYFRDSKFDLETLKEKEEKIYDKLVAWERRYFKLIFRQWLQAHKRYSVTIDISKDWDEYLKTAMKSPAHQQIWEKIIKHTQDFSYHKKNFINYVEKMSNQ